jgi:8-amino-3,8-dideoxy-alpha-D-manno-octulosonate transaminase
MPGTELFGAEERKEIEDVLSTGIMFRFNHDAQRNNIWKAKDFEAEAKKITGAKYALAVSNGSAAIMAALAASGIGTGDEVICPPFTYIATIEAILFLGGLPVFAEIDETLCLSAEGIKKAITPKTKAVCLVHMCGGNANMDEIMAVVNQHNLILVEDAGQAFSASYKGTSTGLFGKAGAYSFDFFKIATAGEGGILVTNDEATYKLADSFCDHGHDHIGSNRGMENHPIIGFNFRISELHAAVGAAQTRKVPDIRKKNLLNKKFMQGKLANTPGLSFAKLGDNEGDSGTFLNILMDEPDMAKRVVDELNKAGIGGFNYWYTNMYHFINQWNHIKELKTASKLAVEVLGAPQDYKNLHLPKTQNVIGRLISFGIYCNWTDEKMTELASKIKDCVIKATQTVNV